MRHRESTVDCATGNVTQVRAKLADGDVAVTDLAYFPNGNLKSVTGPANKAGQRYRLDYGYDTVVGTHVESITDSFGYRSTATYNLQVRAGRDHHRRQQPGGPQQLRRGRPARHRHRPVRDAPRTGRPSTSSTTPRRAVPYAVTRHVDRDADGSVRADTIDTITVHRRSKRPTADQEGRHRLPPAPDSAPANVMTVSGRAVYDFVGRVVEQYYPITEPKGASNTTFNPAFDTVQPTRMSYDVLDRATRTVLPDDTVTTTAYGFGPDRAGVTPVRDRSPPTPTARRSAPTPTCGS